MREQRLTYRLTLLNTLHNDSYRLLLFIVWKASSILFAMAAYGMCLFIFSLYAKIQLKPSVYMGYVLGSLVGLFGSIKQVTGDLHKYNESVKKIETALAKLKLPALK